MFIRGNVWGAPLSGPGNGPCNSDGGENAREIQEKSKRYHQNHKILRIFANSNGPNDGLDSNDD